MINLEWYRTFKAVYKSGTLTGAAAELFISQPGVSLHLSSLENYTGYKLFDRNGRRMVPTERGKALYNFITDALARLEEAEKTFQRSTEKHTPTISVGMCFETFQITLEPFIATLPFNVIIQFGEYPEMADNLQKGILDLIITPQIVPMKGVDYEAFSRENIVVVAGNNVAMHQFNNAAAEGPEAIEAWLKQQKWYGTTGDMEHLRRFWQLNFGKYPDFRPNYIVPNLNSIVRCLGSGEGVAVIPDFLCQREIDSGQIQLLWEGSTKLTNILHFASCKTSIYGNEINTIKDIFKKVMVKP